MESGSQILNYKGDAGLGQGSNGDVPVINSNNNLDVINNAQSNLELMNHNTNIKLYEQKVADRDTALQMFQQGQIASGNIDPNDRPVYDSARKVAEDKFYDMMANGGINNVSAFRDYNTAKDNLSNIVSQAQSRETELAKLQQQKSDATLPQDVLALQNHIQQQKDKGFWQPIDPFQKAFNYDLPSSDAKVISPLTEGSIGSTPQPTQSGTTTWNSTTNKNGIVTNKQTTKTAPLKSPIVNNKSSKAPIQISGNQTNADGSISPYTFTPEKYYDLGTVQKNVDALAASNPTESATYQQSFNDFQDPNKLPPIEQKNFIQALNNRLADYSQQRGIQPIQGSNNPDGTPMYPGQIKYHQNPNGTVVLQETPQSFFAKRALASVNGDYVQKPEKELNPDLVKLNILQQKANSDQFYKHAMAGAAQTKAGAYAANLHQQIKLRKTAADQDNFLNEIYNKNISQQPLIKGEGGTTWSLANIDANNSLPVFTFDGKTPKQLIPIGAKAQFSTDSYTKDDNGKPILKVGAKPMFYSGGHYEPEYLLGNDHVTQLQINQNYLNFRKTKFGSNWQNGIEGYMKEAIKNGLYNVRLKGANGSTDKDLSLAAQRAIANQSTKKGQTLPFADNEQPPTDDQIPDNSDNEQQ